MFVVTLPVSAAKNPHLYAEKAKSEGADILEIRGDITPSLVVFQSPIPLLVSPRGTGNSLIDILKPEYVDLDISEFPLPELARARHPSTVGGGDGGEGKMPKVILSFHDKEKTPDQKFLENIVQKMCSLNPWMIKIATTITSYDDYFTLQNLRTFMNKKSERSTILGMGPKSHLSRVLSPLQNTFTYACLTQSDAAAPGQLTLKDYTRMKHCRNPRVFGLLGGMYISASVSPIIHSFLAEKTKTDLVYALFPTDNLASTFEALRRLGVSGFSATAPWKRKILEFVTVKDPVVLRLESANTLVCKGTEVVAYNTDVVGFTEAYPFLKDSKSVAILGSGGVVPAVIEALRALNSDVAIRVYARNPKQASKALQNHNVDVLSLSELSQSPAESFICAISEDVSLPLPLATRLRLRTTDGQVSHKPSALPARQHALDLRYGTETQFLRDAKEKGYVTQDGLSMLLFQGFAQFEIFTESRLLPSDRESIASSMKPHS